ncbi:MAG TPA: LacI family DNA-binding transcriptional regulator [Chthonomonadaceae bacterium]|nr:LacI family DNA-binding transcriptional regulator [Chthonomonadaceae bacterium]
MPATIKDIARRLNISTSTVSYALNGGPRGVPEEVKEKVLAVARELNYRPNSLARSMVTGRTDTIAIVPPRGTHPVVLSPYIQAVLNAIVEAGEALQQDILLHTAQGDADPEGIARSVMGGRADGIFLIAPSLQSTLAQEIASYQFPCVVFSAEGPERTLTVTIDNAEATRQALDHLVGLGHRQIGHIVGRLAMRDGFERHEAYRTYLKERDLPISEEWIAIGDFAYGPAKEAARKILMAPQPPTAILAANDESGLAAIHVAEELGLRVPEALSIVSYDFLPEAILSSRDLTAVRQPLQQMIAHGMRLLVQWAREGQRPEPARTIFPTELVVRHTTAPPRAS